MQRSDTQEVVDISYSSDGEPHRIRAVLTKDKDGRFTGISYALADGTEPAFDLLTQLLGGAKEPDQVGQVDQAAIDLAAARQYLLAENDRLWIAMSTSSTVSGKTLTLVLDVYNHEDALAQQLTCTVGLGDSGSLLDVLRTPENYLLLEEADGTDRLRVVMDAGQAEPSYREFLWDAEGGMFVGDL